MSTSAEELLGAGVGCLVTEGMSDPDSERVTVVGRRLIELGGTLGLGTGEGGGELLSENVDVSLVLQIQVIDLPS